MSAEPLSHLWCLVCFDDQRPDEWRRHPVTKVTEKRVYVARWNNGSDAPCDYTKVSLDRAKLEADGDVWSNTAGHHFFTDDGMRAQVAEQAARSGRTAGDA